MARRNWRGSGGPVRIDPDTITVLFAIWAFLTGLSLAGPGQAFPQTAIYRVAMELGLSESLVGGGMLLNAVLLVASLGVRTAHTRTAVSMGTAILWSFWAFLLALGGLRAGFFSASAAWTFLASLALASSTPATLNSPATPPGGTEPEGPSHDEFP